MEKLELLRNELTNKFNGKYISLYNINMYAGLKECYNDTPLTAKAKATANLFRIHKKIVYENDIILGSVGGKYAKDINEYELKQASNVVNNFGVNTFNTNKDHFAPDYEYVLIKGVGGMIADIDSSLEKHKDDSDKVEFLTACKITLSGFSDMIKDYANEARRMGKMLEAKVCDNISFDAPKTFREALQLVWLCHISFSYEDRGAMALGRMDQYLYPFYKKDVDKNITKEQVCELLSCTLLKLVEGKYLSEIDTVNICIGGTKKDGTDAVNELSYLILEAVKNCKVCGPNLSARVGETTPDEFYDKSLEVIGTGIGYPALMNNEVNIKALSRYGYDLEDCNDFCMVGCVENFLPGKQPAWSDGRFNSPKYLGYALNNGVCMLNGIQEGIITGDVDTFDTMDKFLEAFKKQLAAGADKYVAFFNNENARYNYRMYSQPYLSCFVPTCIERGLDIRCGGTKYPSVHGVCAMGIATVADSLAAIEKIVYDEKILTLFELRDIIKNNFEGREDIRKKLLNAPKYGNNLEFVDKYAKWFVEVHDEIFFNKRTPDGGRFYIGIASNTANINMGLEVPATPDGRKSQTPLSDAASAMRGMDKDGLTSLLTSLSKPDYSKSALGTVVNVKLSNTIFEDISKRNILREVIKIYFKNGGQEIQTNCVSREMLIDAKKHPENYADLVVRVSGFSAFYTTLSEMVQDDILERLEHK